MRAGTVPKNWADLVKRSSECVTEEKFDLDETWFRQDLSADSVASEPQETDLQKSNTEVKGTTHHPLPLSTTQVNKGDTTHRADTTPENEVRPPSTSNTPANEGETADQALIDQSDQSELQMPAMIDLATTGLRRSPQNQKVTSKRIFGLFTLFCFGTSQTVKPSTGDQSMFSRKIAHVEKCNFLFDETLNKIHPMVFVTNLEKNDSYTFQEMMKQDDKTEFITAMSKEIDDHESQDHWNLMRWKNIPPE